MVCGGSGWTQMADVVVTQKKKILLHSHRRRLRVVVIFSKPY